MNGINPPAYIDRDGQVWPATEDGDLHYEESVVPRHVAEGEYGPLVPLWPRETPEPEPEMVTATYPGDTWERMQEVAAMDGATARCEWFGAVITGPASTPSTDCITLGDWIRAHRIDREPLTVTAPKPPEPERYEWADALVIRWDEDVWAKDWDGHWLPVGRPGLAHIKQIFESNKPVTVLVDADGKVVGA